MQGTLTISLAKPVTSVEILGNYGARLPCNASQHDARGAAATFSGHSEVNSASETQQHAFVMDAERQKANAIIGVRFTTSMVMQNAAEVLAYGTGVVLE